LTEFYRIERSLAKKLSEAPRSERLQLYRELYNELFERIPYHPMLVYKQSALQKASDVAMQMRFLRRFVRADMSVLEIGAGDCTLSVELTNVAKMVYALDVSDVITGGQIAPRNLELILSDGTSVPLPRNSVDVAYSNQLIEHLHPEDAREQLSNILAVLKPRGRYICVTPSRLAGPHDVSRFFDETATCFHLKEYTYSELSHLFLKTGFHRVEAYLGYQTKGIYVRLPLAAIRFIERRAESMTRFSSYEDRQRIMNLLPYRQLRDIRVAGVK
jgi:SAM-dependent methyltransferase